MPGSEKEYRYWGKRASTHDSDLLCIVGPTITNEIEAWLVDQFEDTDMVLELGCGSGGFSEMTVTRVKHLVTTDLAPEMIEKAKQKLSQFSNVEIQIEDCYETSFEDGLFDAILLVNLLHIVKAPIAVLKECDRVLKDGGRVVIADFTGYGMGLFNKMGLGFRYLKKWGKPAPYSRNLTPDELVRITRGAGFVVEESRLVGKDIKAVCLRARKAA